MAEKYRKMPLRWRTREVWISICALAVVTLLLEIFFMNYMVAHGLESMIDAILVDGWKFTIPTPLAFAVAMIVVVIACWAYLVEGTAIIGVRSDLGRRSATAPVRMVEAGSSILVAFAFSLFAPYIIGSDWFGGIISGSFANNPQLHGLASGITAFMIRLGDLEILWKYVISQNVSGLAVAFFSITDVWRHRRTTRPR